MTDATASASGTSPTSTPPEVRAAHRWLFVSVVVVFAASILIGITGLVIELLIMVGVPLYVMARVGYARLSRLRDASQDRARRTSRGVLLRAGQTAVRSIPTFGGGFYGLVATLTFLTYQLRELSGGEWLAVEAWTGPLTRASTDPFGFLTGEFAMLLWDLLIPISANWILGLVHAAIWPVYVLQWGGLWGLGAVIVLGVAYSRVMPRLWPVVLARVATRDARVMPRSATPSSKPGRPIDPAEATGSTE